MNARACFGGMHSTQRKHKTPVSDSQLSFALLFISYQKPVPDPMLSSDLVAEPEAFS